MAHLFICPSCGNRSAETDRTAGFTRQAKGCSKCGFGFLFELLDDYYPAPNAAFFVCDQKGARHRLRPRLLRADRPRRRARHRPQGQRRARPCRSKAATTTSRPCSSGACARSASPSRSTPRATCPRPRRRTSFRRMTTTADCCSCSRRPSRLPARLAVTDRRRNLFVLLLVLGLLIASLVVIATKPTKLGLDLQGGVELIYEAKAHEGRARRRRRRSIARSTSCASASTSSASPSRRSSAPATTQISVALPDCQEPQRRDRAGRHGRPARVL